MFVTRSPHLEGASVSTLITVPLKNMMGSVVRSITSSPDPILATLTQCRVARLTPLVLPLSNPRCCIYHISLHYHMTLPMVIASMLSMLPLEHLELPIASEH